MPYKIVGGLGNVASFRWSGAKLAHRYLNISVSRNALEYKDVAPAHHNLCIRRGCINNFRTSPLLAGFFMELLLPFRCQRDLNKQKGHSREWPKYMYVLLKFGGPCWT